MEHSTGPVHGTFHGAGYGTFHGAGPWKIPRDRLIEDAERLEQDLPNMALLIAEAQSLHAGWEFDSPSYLRAYLDNGQWGSNHLWDNIARHAYSVFLSLYLLPLRNNS